MGFFIKSSVVFTHTLDSSLVWYSCLLEVMSQNIQRLKFFPLNIESMNLRDILKGPAWHRGTVPSDQSYQKHISLQPKILDLGYQLTWWWVPLECSLKSNRNRKHVQTNCDPSKAFADWGCLQFNCVTRQKFENLETKSLFYKICLCNQKVLR